MRRLLVLIALLALSGCGQVQLSVTRYHVLDARPRTFAILPLPSQLESLEFQHYASMVRDQLQQRGWQTVTSGEPECAVFLQYAISAGTPVAFSYPILGQVPTGNSTTFGTVNSGRNATTFSATTTQQTTTGIVGTGTGTKVVYDRAVQLTMLATPSYRGPRDSVRVYEATVRSPGSIGNLNTVMPVLLRGLFQEFPGNSGTTRSLLL